MLANVATPVGTAIVMREMATYGTDAVAGIAIIGRLVPVAFSVVLALSGAIGPIIGQNFGANLPARVQEAFIAALKFTLVYVVVVSAILFATRGLIADAFGAIGEDRTLLFLFCGPIALTFVFNGAIFVSNASFNNLGKPLYSTYVNWATNTLGIWPFVLVGSALMGAEGILIGRALGTAVFGILATVLALRLTRDTTPTPEPTPAVFAQRAHTVHVQRGH